MNDNNDQYAIDTAEDVAFLLTYQSDPALDTVYVFRGQLDRAEESLWREQALVYMSVRYGLDAGVGKIDGFHWLDAIQLDQIGYLNGGCWVEIVDRADFARLPL